MAKKNVCGGGSGAIYGLGLIGALVYFFQNTPDPISVFTNFFKALVWPAYAVFFLLKFLGA